MQPTDIALLTVLALLVGALLPLLVQARATLRSAQFWLDDSGPRLAQALRELSLVSRELGGAARQADMALQQARAPLSAVASFSSALVPAVIAAIQAWRGGPQTSPTPEGAESPATGAHGGTSADEEAADG